MNVGFYRNPYRVPGDANTSFMVTRDVTGPKCLVLTEDQVTDACHVAELLAPGLITCVFIRTGMPEAAGADFRPQ